MVLFNHATREMTAVEDLMWCLGRLMGLAGTVRFDLPDEFRKELRETLDRLEAAIKRIPEPH